MADSSGTHLWLVLMKAHRSMARHAQRSIAAHGAYRETVRTSVSVFMGLNCWWFGTLA
jgi:hypothetical protein